MPHKDDLDFKRRRFGGAVFTDKYASSGGNDLLPHFMQNLQKLGGLPTTVAQSHQERILKYQKLWRLYNGDHWRYQPLGETRKQKINYCRRFVDFSSDFLVGNLWVLEPFQGNEGLKELADTVWEEMNDRETLVYDMATVGGVTGDCFVQVTMDVDGDTMENGEPGIKLVVLDSSTVFPIYDPHDKRRMIRCLISYPIYDVDEKGSINWQIYTQDITREKIKQYIDGAVIDDSKNPLGEINVVHVHNLPGFGSYGISDIDDISDLNEEFNEKLSDTSDIIQYHGAPTTLVFGARIENIEKGANKVWGLPKDARVENLELISDLPATVRYLELLRLAMHELTATPLGALGETQPISNTSGVALHMNYLPLMKKTVRKQRTYGNGILRITHLALRWMEESGLVKFRPEAGSDSAQNKIKLENPILWRRMKLRWDSPLPKDRLIEMQLIAQKLNSGITSRAQALRDLGTPPEDVEQILEEIDNDTTNPMRPAGTETNLGGINTEEETAPEKKADVEGETPARKPKDLRNTYVEASRE